MKKIVFATHNQNKLEEVRAMLSDYEVLGLTDIGCAEEIPETADTFVGNADLKVAYVKTNFGFDSFADDSGLEVFALNNEPGVYSARYAGEPVNHKKNIQKILKNLEGITNRKARFVSCISLDLNGKKQIFEGYVQGDIIEHERGVGGFGYDPIFVPEGFSKTFAEMTLVEKSKLSHRGQAVQKLVAFLNKTSK